MLIRDFTVHGISLNVIEKGYANDCLIKKNSVASDNCSASLKKPHDAKQLTW